MRWRKRKDRVPGVRKEKKKPARFHKRGGFVIRKKGGSKKSGPQKKGNVLQGKVAHGKRTARKLNPCARGKGSGFRTLMEGP